MHRLAAYELMLIQQEIELNEEQEEDEEQEENEENEEDEEDEEEELDLLVEQNVD